MHEKWPFLIPQTYRNIQITLRKNGQTGQNRHRKAKSQPLRDTNYHLHAISYRLSVLPGWKKDRFRGETYTGRAIFCTVLYAYHIQHHPRHGIHNSGVPPEAASYCWGGGRRPPPSLWVVPNMVACVLALQPTRRGPSLLFFSFI